MQVVPLPPQNNTPVPPAPPVEPIPSVSTNAPSSPPPPNSTSTFAPKPKRPLPKFPTKVFVGLFGLLIFCAVVALVIWSTSGLRPSTSNPPDATSSATPVQTSQEPVVVTATPEIKRLPLNDLNGHELITASENSLWLTQFTPTGPRKSLLLNVGSRVVDMTLSPNRQLLAFTFTNPTVEPGQFEYPKTGLKVLDLRDKSLTEYISLSNQSVRNPTWSPDNLYLAVWNNGQSNVLFDISTKRRILEVISSGQAPLGPIVFVPQRNLVSYIENNQLIESEYTGDKRAVLITGVNSIRQVHEGPALPDVQFYSPEARFIAYHNQVGQLMVFDRSDGSIQILAEGSNSGPSGGYFSFGEPITFTSSGNLVYYDLRKDNYSPGVDDNPIYIYTPATKSNRPFFSDRKTSIQLTSATPDLVRKKLLFHDRGFLHLSEDGNMLSNCNYNNFSFDYYNWGGGINYTSPLKVWSPDSNFVLSTTNRQIADVNTCSFTAPFDTQAFHLAIWSK